MIFPIFELVAMQGPYAHWGSNRSFAVAGKLGVSFPALFTVLSVLFPGWGVGIAAPMRPHPSFAAMVPSTALLFARSSASLIIWSIHPGQHFAKLQ